MDPPVVLRILSVASKISISNSKSISTNVSNSNLKLINGVNAKIKGNLDVIQADTFEDLLLEGNDNTLIVKNSKDCVWSGSLGNCQLDVARNIGIYGNKNLIMGRCNSHVIICGHNNSVAANENENLKVRGHSCVVSATRTLHMTVDGDDNLATVSDTTVRHFVSKSPPGLDTGLSFSNYPENIMEFCGSPTASSVYEKNLCPCPQLTSALIQRSHPLSTVTYKDYDANDPSDIGSWTIMPQVRIRYVDKAIIKGNAYQLGSFNIFVDGLSIDMQHRHLPIKVKVHNADFDEHSFQFYAAPDKKSIMFAGARDGYTQTLKIVGNRVSDMKVDGSFFVYYDIETEEETNPPEGNENDEEMDAYDYLT